MNRSTLISPAETGPVSYTHLSLVYNGNTLSTEHLALEQSETEPLMHDIKEDHGFKENEQVRVYDAEGKFIAVYRYHAAECMFKVEKMFV